MTNQLQGPDEHAKDLLNFAKAMPRFCVDCDHYVEDPDLKSPGRYCDAHTDQYWACVRAYRSDKIKQGPVQYHTNTGEPIISNPERFNVRLIENSFDRFISSIGPVDEEVAQEIAKQIAAREDFDPVKYSIKIRPVEG